MLYAGLTLVFSMVLALFLVVYKAAAGGRRVIKSRLEAIRDQRPEGEEEDPLRLPFRERVLKPLETKIIKFLSSLLPVNVIAFIDYKLTQSGKQKKLKATTFLSGIIYTTFILTALGFFMPLMLGLGFKNSAAAAAAAFFLSAAMPLYWLFNAAEQRIKQIEQALPDAIDLMVVCVEAGLGFDMAMAKVCERMRGPLSEEFTKALNEMKMGRTRQAALRDMLNRIDSYNVTSFLSMVIQGTQMGVSMGRILRVQSETMRLVRRQKAQELAMKAPVKMVFPMVFCIFPALFVVILGPAVIQVLDSGFLK